MEEICEIAATDKGADSEPAPKQIPNLKNLQNFPNQHGKSGTKTHFAIAENAASFANGLTPLTTARHKIRRR